MVSTVIHAKPSTSYRPVVTVSSKRLSTRFKLGFIINSAFMLFEYTVGFLSGSLILIADASHNLTDSITLAVSWAGNQIAKKPADSGHSFGHGRSSVLSAFINSSILIAIALLIFFEAYQRFIHPVPLEGGAIAIVAIVGIFANGSVTLLFRKYTYDLNVKAAYTNMAFDAVFSVAAFIAGLLILLTHKTWIDPLISIGVGIGLLYAAVGILRQATHIFLEGVPKGMSISAIRNLILINDAVASVSDIHAWTLASDEHIVCCTIVPKEKDYAQLQQITKDMKRELRSFGFSKVIIEVA